MQHDQVLIIALGHEYRKDDGFGAHVLRKLKGEAGGTYEGWLHSGDATDLLERWNRRKVIVIDVCESQGNPGRLHVLRPLHAPCLLAEKTISSHGLGLAETLAVGDLLGKLPRELIVLTVEGQDFSSGQGLSAPVSSAVDDALSQLKKILAEKEIHHA